MNALRNIIRTAICEASAYEELSSKWDVGGYYAIPAFNSSFGVALNLFDDTGNNVGEIYEDGRFYYNDGRMGAESFDRAWRVKSDLTFDPKEENDVRNALRQVFLARVGKYQKKGNEQKGMPDKIQEGRGMGEPQPIKVKKTINIPKLNGWYAEYALYDEEEVGEPDYWVWDIMDKDGEQVGSLLNDGTLNYEGEDGYENVNDIFPAVDFKRKPQKAASYLYVLKSRDKMRASINEVSHKKEPSEYSFRKKYELPIKGWTAKKYHIKNHPDIWGWKFFDLSGKPVGFVTPNGELKDSWDHEILNNYEPSDKKSDKNWREDPKTISQLLYLKLAQKKLHNKEGLLEIRGAEGMEKPDGPFDFPDIGGYSASGPYLGGDYEDEEYSYWSITDEKGTEVGHLKTDGTVLYVDPDMSKEYNYPMWDEASHVNFNTDYEGIRRAVMYVYLKRQVPIN